MDIPTTILFVTSGVILFSSLIVVSYKTGFVSFSMMSMTRKDQPRFGVKTGNISKFIGAICGAFVINVVYGCVVVRDLQQTSGILLVSLINTVFIAYALVYVILLKEKNDT